MHTDDNPSSSSPSPAPKGRKGSFWLTILSVGLLVACAAIVYQAIQTNDLRRQFGMAQQDNAALRSTFAKTNADLRKALSSVQDELAEARQETGASLEKARTEATRHADVITGRLAKKAEQQTQQLSEELGKVAASAQEASNKLDGISTQVGSVKGDVATAKTDIQDTKSELQRTRGDLGMISGLIATNSKQIQTLRNLGDRNIFEFTVTKSGSPQKVGNIEVVLRKADPRHNRYTIEVLADDKRVEKKDRTINEPVQFYTSAARQPDELVVNQVEKNKIVGYLATPRVTVSRNEGPTGAR